MRPTHGAGGKPAGWRFGVGGFTLFEALLALAVFVLAFGGLLAALDSALGAGLEARNVSRLRHELESRLAYCMVDPPGPGQKRVVEAKANRGFRVEESLEPFQAENANREVLDGLWTLDIQISIDGETARAQTLLYRP